MLLDAPAPKFQVSTVGDPVLSGLSLNTISNSSTYHAILVSPLIKQPEKRDVQRPKISSPNSLPISNLITLTPSSAITFVVVAAPITQLIPDSQRHISNALKKEAFA